MSGSGPAGGSSWRAVIDIGSVSTGLLLTDGEHRVRRSVDTRLGAGSLAPNGDVIPGAIAAAALDELRSVLVDYRHLVDQRGAAIQAIGTSVARRASNLADLDAVVADALGVPLRVVDAREEAELTFAGARSCVPTDDGGAGPHVVTIDLGGGSTEFAAGGGERAAAGGAGGPVESWSAPIGGVLITQAYLHGDPPEPEELSAALSVVELHLDDLRRDAPALAAALNDPGTVVVGLGGFVTIAAVEVGLLDDDPLNGDGDGPVHAAELDRAAIEDVFRTLATETRLDRAHNPGLPATRVDDIVGGCVVLVETMRQFGLETVVVSQRGLADGALLEVVGEPAADRTR